MKTKLVISVALLGLSLGGNRDQQLVLYATGSVHNSRHEFAEKGVRESRPHGREHQPDRLRFLPAQLPSGVRRNVAQLIGGLKDPGTRRLRHVAVSGESAGDGSDG